MRLTAKPNCCDEKQDEAQKVKAQKRCHLNTFCVVNNIPLCESHLLDDEVHLIAYLSKRA